MRSRTSIVDTITVIYRTISYHAISYHIIPWYQRKEGKKVDDERGVDIIVNTRQGGHLPLPLLELALVVLAPSDSAVVVVAAVVVAGRTPHRLYYPPSCY